jgi:multidrug resistance efflux pump
MKRFLTKRYLVILVILLTSLASWRVFVIRKKATTKPTPPPPTVTESSLILSGELRADRQVDLQFQASGLLSWVGVKEGDSVKKYQTLAMLDQRSLKKNLEKYLNLYLKTRWDFEQKHADNKDYEVSDLSTSAKEAVKRTLEKAQFDLNNAVLDVELQDLVLQYSRLVTPIEGLITRVDQPYAGVNILYTDKISVVDPQSLYFEVTADQSEVVKIKKADKVKITLDAYPEQKLFGQIAQVGFTPKTDEVSTVYQVKIEIANFNNQDFKYRLGMTGDAEFNP